MAQQKPMAIDISNAVELMSWPDVERKPLLPVFEAIHNSIQSIQESNIEQGKIVIRLTRKSDDLEPACIVSIEVEDNGIGFTRDNVESFGKLFTPRKKAIFNCKGIGRLSFFALFFNVEIRSTYSENGKKYLFEHTATEHNLHNIASVPATSIGDSENKTIVTLSKIKSGREKYLRIPESTVQGILTQHFLPSLLSTSNISIQVVDGEEYFLDDSVKDVHRVDPVVIDGNIYKIFHLKNRSSHNSSHKIILSADGRSVRDIPLAFLPKGKIGVDDDKFYLTTVVISDYLNANLNTQRTDFTLPKIKGIDSGKTSIECIASAVSDTSREYCRYSIQKLEEVLEKHIQTTFEELPHLSFLRDDNDVRRTLKIGDDTTTVKNAYIKKFAEKQVESFNYVKRISQEYDSSNIPSFDDFQRDSLKKLEEGMQLNHAPLVSYVTYRDFVLGLYNKLLESHDGKSYQPEKILHGLLFPTRQESGDAINDYQKHNLWLIDDRYALYDFVASDLYEHQISKGSADRNNKRYDICAAYADPIGEYHNVFIIELKKTCKALAENNDPVVQIKNYVLRMMNGKLKKHNNTRINVTDSTQYYGLVLCDIHNKYFTNTMIKSHSLKKRPDGKSFHTVLLNDSFFLEVMNYENLLDISRARNRVFIEKLRLMK
jgi:hypothetical protein